MIKLTAAISKRHDWTNDEWLTHYKERHASLSASVRNFNRHALRYLQNYAYQVPDVPAFPDRDAGRVGVTELWFDDVEALKAAYTEPDYLKYLRPDELRFCTFDNIVAGVAQETEILADTRRTPGDKAYVDKPRDKIYAFRTRTGALSHKAFCEAWRSERAPLLLGFTPFRQLVRRYVQSEMLDQDVGLPGGVAHDLIDEFWFDTKNDAVSFWKTYRAAAEMAQQEVGSASDKTWIVIAREHEVFGPLPGEL